MTHTVGKSRIPNAKVFADQVDAYAAEMTQWSAHMVEVTAGNAQAYPPPNPAPDIAAAVRRNVAKDGTVTFVPDYEIVDDGPPPELLLLQKKGALFNVVAGMERMAGNAVLPIGKRRLQNILLRPALIKKATLDGEAAQRAAGIEIKVKTKPLTDDEQSLLDEADSIKSKMDAIDLHAAEMLSEIEDLTLDTIDGWKPTPFTV